MPGTPMEQQNSALTQLQTDNPQNEPEHDDEDEEDEQKQQYRPDPSARELTQTDKLNKRLLESLLERMNKSDGEFDRYMDNKEDDEDLIDNEEESNEF